MYEFNITKEEYQKFLAYYNWWLLSTPTYRLGQAFLNHFDGANEYLESISNLGTPPDVYTPDMNHILWNEKSYDKAKSMIEEFIDII